MKILSLSLVLLVLAWSGATAQSGDDMPTSDAATAPASPSRVPESLQALNAAARSGAVVEVLHGREVADPYRSLEQDNEATWAWVAAQTAHAQAYFEAHAREERSQRLGELLSIGYLGEVSLSGDRVFFTKRDGDLEQAALFAAEVGGEPELLVDPNALGERVAIDWVYPSPSGRYVAYGLSRDGDERSTLRVLDTTTGEHLGEAIPHTKWCGLAWLHDESGFYYTRYPLPGESGYDAESEDTYHRNLFFHALGADYREDSLVFEPGRTEWVSPHVSADDAFVTLNVFHGWSRSDVHLLFRRAEQFAGLFGEAEPVPVPVVVGEPYLVYGGVQADRLVLFSNQDHPRGRILSAPVPVALGLTGIQAAHGWTELVGEGAGVIESFQMGGDRLLVQYVEDIAARLALFDLGGGLLGDIPLPTRGSVSAMGISPDGARVAFTFASYFHPPALYELSVPGADAGAVGAPALLDSVAAQVDAADYTLERASVTSADGTEVNVFLVHRRDLVPDGRRPVLLYGYGGFNASMMPGFTRNALYWLERGGVYAVANIRGGGEHGEAWHEAGMLHNKPNSFDDFEAVIRWLSESGLSSPERIAILGASNGGLLVGAMITRCPEAFGVAVASVGLYDMVRFTDFPPAEIWMSEYGDPSELADFEVLLGYSPYHNVVDGRDYPAVLIDTAERDTRVSWRHSTKFAARLQEAVADREGARPVLFTMGRDQGHGAGTGVSALVEQYVRYYTFIETELGL